MTKADVDGPLMIIFLDLGFESYIIQPTDV